MPPFTLCYYSLVKTKHNHRMDLYFSFKYLLKAVFSTWHWMLKSICIYLTAQVLFFPTVFCCFSVTVFLDYLSLWGNSLPRICHAVFGPSIIEHTAVTHFIQTTLDFVARLRIRITACVECASGEQRTTKY